MSLRLFYHPLSSFCHKALIALYENDVSFEPVFVDLGNKESSAELRSLWPVGKFPVLRDDVRNCTVAEATVIIEYLDTYYPGARKLVPPDPGHAWQARMWDRFFDLYVNVQVQKIVVDRLRPAGAGDAFGVEQARAMIETCYAMVERTMAGKAWAIGDDYGLVDCAASPALFYANHVVPIDRNRKNLTADFDRLMARPSCLRVLRQAQPYFHLVPTETKPSLPMENA